MDRGLQRLGIVAAIALAAGLSGCALLSKDDSAKLHAQAQADLSRWADAVASAGGQSAFAPVGELTAQVGDWETSVGDNNKPALMAGMVEAAIALPAETPPDGQVRWQDGSTETVPLVSAQDALAAVKAGGGGSCAECVPLKITAARLTSGTVQTSRGPAQAPVWEFTLQGTAVRMTRVAVTDATTVVPPTWNPSDPPVGISIEWATGTADGKKLTVGFTGAPGPASQGCGADYTAEAVESQTAVVVIVTKHPHSAFGETCSAVGAVRTAEVELAAPLGNRAVLEVREGRPVAVTPTH
jgi:hypothetical protein